MTLASKPINLAIIVFSLILLGSVQTSYAWRLFDRTNELFAVGQFESEHSYLYRIDPLSGELTLIGDTGLNNCTGLDFTPDGKLKAFCELREQGDIITKNGSATPGVTAELDPDDGFPEWAVPHGISNIISDISINDSGELFSYEDIEVERVHKHLEENDFMASLVGETGIKAEDHAIAFWGEGVLKMATNTGTPALYRVDTESGVATKMAALSFPDSLIAAGSFDTRVIQLENIEFASMDSMVIDAFRFPVAAVNARAGVYAFEERDADFVVLMNSLNGLDIDAAGTNREFELELWGAVALLDSETSQIDFIVDIQGDVDVRAITVRPIEPRPIPTMSEWGLIFSGSSLLILAIIFLVRRNKYSRA